MQEMLSEMIFPLLLEQPERYAYVTGSSEYPQICGMVLFYRFRKGTVVVADISGLPDNGSGMYGENRDHTRYAGRFPRPALGRLRREDCLWGD